jgi:crotonobetainyl-CoA:carnitine CoA-transferase CaiB-like acyl-CoA transferase
MSIEEAEARLGALGVCYGRVNSLPEALDDPNVRARGAVVTDGRGRRHLASPIRFAAEPAQPRLQAPRLGEHTREAHA